MKPSIQFWLSCGIALCTLGTTSPTTAQIVPDATLPQNSSVTPGGNTSIINGGTRAGSNLFHSFQQFSVPTNGVAFFNNALDIQNIISRVTGSSISNIDGLIRANGAANLFLLNPNGIVFGPNASLNVGGSFLASTASSLNFADGTQFSATAHPTTPLLTVSVPIGLQFGGTAGRILVQGPGNDLSIDPTTSEFVRGNPAGLAVQPGKTLALVGGDVTLEGGNLIAQGGRIEVGSIAGSGLVSLTPIDKGWTLGYSGVPTYGNIQLSQRASVDASGSGGGDIQVQGRRVTLTDGSAIFALTLGSNPGGTVAVNASDSVEVIGTSAAPLFLSAVFTDTQGAGAAGDLTINTGQLLVRDGAVVTADSAGAGNAGNLTVNAGTSVTLSGTTADGEFISGLFATTSGDGAAGEVTITTGKLLVQNGAQVSSETSGRGKAGNLTVNADTFVELSGITADGIPSGLFARTYGDGAAGDLTITTRQLLVQNGAEVTTETFGAGNAGNLTVNADTSVKLIRTAGSTTGLFAQVGQRGATGNPGNLTINTGQLLVQDGAMVSTATFGTGAGGTLKVNASESVELSGTSPDNRRVPSRLRASTSGAGDAGNLMIETGQLTVRNGAEVSVRSTGSGKAGNLQLTARSIRLDNQGQLIGTTQSAKGGGNITLQAQDLQLRRNSNISATAGGIGNSGNITIDTGTLVALEDSNITANAFKGQGGNIKIRTQGLFRSPDSDITASSELGINGTVQINSVIFDPAEQIVALPGGVVDASGLIARGCSEGDGETASQFTVAGRGGLPTNPGEPLTSDVVWEDARLTAVSAVKRSHVVTAAVPSTPDAAAIVPATGWVFNDKGEVTLTATAPNPTPVSFGSTSANCPVR